MKKALIFLFFLFTASYGYSQLDFGLRGGITTAKLSTNLSDYNSESILGWHGGAFARIHLGKHPFLQPECYFTQKGGNLINKDANNEYEIKLNSVDVPILLGLKFLNLKVVKFTVYGGPVVSFISQKTVKYYEDGIQIIPTDPDPEDEIKNTTWGMQAGASIDVLILTLDIRHEWGLTDLMKDPETEFKSGVWIIGLGIRIF